jgi:hypothetical protein
MKLFSSFAFFVTVSCSALSPLLGQELLLHYNFDEAASGNIPTLDRSGTDPLVDGRFFDNATRTSNTPGGASIGALDVTQGAASVLANHSSQTVASLDGKLDNLNEVTVTLWLNLQGTPRDLDRIFSTGNQGIGLRIINPVGEEAGPISTSNFSIGFDTADGTVPSYTNFDADNKWIFLAVTFSNNTIAEMVHFYRGDEYEESVVVRSLDTLARFATTTLNDHLRIGRHPSVNNREMNGYVDDFRIYRGALNAYQIEAIRLENLQPFTPPPTHELLLRYNFDEATAGDQEALDLSGKAPLVHGRFFENATRTTNTPAGASAAALDVTAAGASLLVNQTELGGKLDNLSAFTATLWLNLQSDPRALDRIFRAGNTQGFGFRIVAASDTNISAANFGLALDLMNGAVTSAVDFDADNKWIFLAVTFDAAADGERVRFLSGDATRPTELKAIRTTPTLSTGVLDSTLRLGRHPTAGTRLIDGFIDDFRVYRGALSLEMIEAIRLENLEGGLPATGFDDWRAAHFSGADLQNPAISGPAADPDGDGVTNLLEYALGGNPGAPSRDRLPSIGMEAIEVEGVTAVYLTLSFSRPSDVADVNYAVESSADLSNWAADAVLVDSQPTGNGVLETYRAPAPIGQAPRTFLRLRVEKQ